MISAKLKSFFHIDTTQREFIPPIFQEFNILTGYRLPYRDWKYYFQSFYKVHNESINIWSHALGVLIILWHLVTFCQRNMDQHPYTCHIMINFGIGSILVHLASTIAHLIHNKEADIHCNVFFCDNSFVSIGGFCESLSAFYFLAEPEFYDAMELFIVELLLIFSMLMSFTYNYALARYKRQYNINTIVWMYLPAAAFFIVGLQPILHKIYKFTLLDLFFDPHLRIHILHVVCVIVGAVCYATCIPERYFKGRLDILGHSHQIFHILFTVGHCLYFMAVQRDIDANYAFLPENRIPHLQISTIYLSLLGLIIFNIALICFFIHLCRVHKNIWTVEEQGSQNERNNKEMNHKD